jgi:microcystin-dependent protein
LGIQNGDTLATVENAIISFVTPFLNGSGIKPLIDLDIICDVVRQYIPTCVECNGFNLNDILTAIIKAVCDLQIQINNIVADIAIIEADYEVGCIEEVSASAGTHDILQAVINTLCQVQADLATLSLDLSTNYVRVNQINDYIAAYLNANTSNLVNAKMIPYVALEFYGDLIGKFDFTGAGIGAWSKIYLCNGNNNTPDKRGRVAVCAIQDMGGGQLDPQVDPAENPLYNPNYVINDNSYGVNFITLDPLQMPNHTHPASSAIAGSHAHYTVVAGTQTDSDANSLYNGTFAGRNDLGLVSRALPLPNNDNFDYELVTTTGTINAGKTSTNGEHTHTITVESVGNGLPHSNVQPVYPCYYIMYIP